jgi:putative redox protein
MFTATARSIDSTLQHRIDVNGRHEIVTDEPTSVGGHDSAPAPHELLPAMLASCVSTMIMLYAQKRDWQLGDVSVDVQYDNESTPRRVATTIHLPDGLSADQIRRLEMVAEACPVKRALEAGFTFEHEIVATSTELAV